MWHYYLFSFRKKIHDFYLSSTLPCSSNVYSSNQTTLPLFRENQGTNNQANRMGWSKRKEEEVFPFFYILCLGWNALIYLCSGWRRRHTQEEGNAQGLNLKFDQCFLMFLAFTIPFHPNRLDWPSPRESKKRPLLYHHCLLSLIML
jgi:hypothetical protein